MFATLRTLQDDLIELEDAAIEHLRSGLHGRLLQPDQEGYEPARGLWNGMIDKRPGLIMQPSGAVDVQQAIRFARDHDGLVSVKGGGHNIAGTAACDGGLMIDFSAMKGIHVDPQARTVRVEPGCAWADVDHETQAFGLAVPNGAISTTGVAGLTLGGGFGWTSRRYGLTSDNLLSADIVTAEGERVRASARENPDLFWGLRGGGGNFGVVTSFEFEAQAVGPEVLAGMILFPFDKARSVIEFFREFTAYATDELTSLLILRKAPPAPFLPEKVHGEPVCGIAVCHIGPSEEAEQAVRPLKELGEPLVDLIGRKPFMAHQTMLDAASPHGRQYYWKSDYFHDLPDAAVDAMIAHSSKVTSPLSSVLFMHLGGAANRLSKDHSAAGPRDINYVLNVQGSWLEPAETPKHVSWVRDYWQAMQPYSSGRAYMNFLTADEGAERIHEAYDDETYHRLREIKARWDPANYFRLNQNIEPAGTMAGKRN